MELPITTNTLRRLVNESNENREKEIRECILSGLASPESVATELQRAIQDSVFKQDKLDCFRITAGIFPYIYRRFGEPKQVQKEIWFVLADYLKNFPAANRIVETVESNVNNEPVSARLVLCFNLP